MSNNYFRNYLVTISETGSAYCSRDSEDISLKQLQIRYIRPIEIRKSKNILQIELES